MIQGPLDWVSQVTAQSAWAQNKIYELHVIFSHPMWSLLCDYEPALVTNGFRSELQVLSALYRSWNEQV